MISDGIDSRDSLLRLIRRWPWLLLATCVGGLLGLGLSSLRPPIYEAVAVVGVGIDYGRTLPLDDEAMRHASDRAREVFLADEVLQTVIAEAGLASGDRPIRVNTLRDSLRLSDVGGGWELGVRGPSPENSAELANLWADSSVHALEAAARHAWRAAELQAKWYFAGCRLQPVTDAPESAVWACATAPDEYDPEQALTQLEEEAALSRGIMPSMSFSTLQQADPPERPLTGSRGMAVLAGLLSGALAGVVAAAAWPRRDRA